MYQKSPLIFADASRKHPLEMMDDVLISLGFTKKESPISGDLAWTHIEDSSEFYYHILTPRAVTEALMGIGAKKFKARLLESIEEI